MYKKTKRLGEGQTGITYLVRKGMKKYAMKCFKPEVSLDAIKQEIKYQLKAAEAGIAPEIHDFDLGKNSYIVMELMDGHLFSNIATGIELSKDNQKDIIFIFKTLDELGFFQNDCNLMNYMFKHKSLYMIDYGMVTDCDPTKEQNLTLGRLGFILKLKEYGMHPRNWKYIK
jgi:predicted Ser/Thr protein kinase